MHPFDLVGRTALVTGSSRGIGRAIAVAFARAGADVAVNARTEEALAGVREAVEAHGRKAIAVPADVTDADAVRRMVDDAIGGLGKLDIVVNNAGGNTLAVPLVQTRFTGWQKVQRFNLDSVVHVLQAVGPHLDEQGRGSVINVTSIAGLSSIPHMSAYGAAKAAVISLTKAIALEWAGSEIRVNALCPGWTATDLTAFLRESDRREEKVLRDVPMRRWGRPEEIANAAVFLASDASSYVTGQVLVVDGGYMAR
jgi:NAD(P)-dependent dehydrogenase (short-subunit alcohol dehydrogenase family)